MKRIIFVLSMLLVASVASADSLDKIARKYKSKEGAVYIASLDDIKEMEKLSNVEVEIGEKDAFVELISALRSMGVKQMRALLLGDCSEDVRNAFSRDIYKALPDGYESFLRLSDKDNGLRLYTYKKKEHIKLLFISTGVDNNCAFIEVDSENELLNTLLNF